jgi:tRNA(fMet)-specific endonuclease VapC
MKVKCLIDTDWVIHYMNGQPAVTHRLGQLASQGLAISVITLAELYEGVLYSRDPEKNKRGLADFLRGVTVIGIDDETCQLFGKERGRLRTAKKRVGDFDLLIGVTARQHGLTLLTNNRRHFTLLEGLALESV